MNEYKEESEYIQLKERNQQLEELVKAAELERENNAKFWVQISYELRNSLNGIIGMSNLWKNEIYDIDNVKEGFEKIQDCSRMLVGITNGIIDYTTIGNQSVSLQETTFNLKDMITSLTTVLYGKTKEYENDFRVYVQGVLDEELLGDAQRLTQILDCLLNGTLKMTPKGGRLEFILSQISSSGGVAYMRYTFRIVGEHLDKEKLKRYTARVIASDNHDFQWGFEGNDIDLYVCAYFINMMKGTILVKENSENEYELILDLAFKKIKQDESIEQYTIYNDDRILLVADDEESCKERGKTLTQMGISFDYATEVNEALDKIGEADNNKKPYGICIIDWYAKRISIRDLVYHIRNIFGKEIVIIATAYDANQCMKEAQKVGVNYVIEQAWFRSTIYSALMKIEHGQVNRIMDEKFLEHEYDFSGRNVLVAEDMKLNLEVVEKLLIKAKIQVFSAMNGAEAVELFENSPEDFFDCILMDVNMPVMDGYEASRRIRSCAKADAKYVPIYALTANTFAEDIVDALDAGMDGHIAKPVEFDVLFRTLEKVFNESDERKTRSEELSKQVAEFEEKNAKLERQNEELRLHAERDPLTKLLNRYGFELEIKKLAQSKEPVGFVLIDLDKFKNINDEMGHEVGDKALIKVAVLLKNHFRTSDIVVRFGGDEFGVLLKGFTMERDFVIKKIHDMNEELGNPVDGIPPLSVSAGAAFCEHGYREDLYQLADKALYEVKNNGRRGCIINQDNVLNMSEDAVSWNKSWYGEEVYYAKGDNGKLIDDRQAFADLLLKNSRAVGLVSGFYTEGMPVYSISAIALQNLGYTYEEFLETTEGSFEKLVFSEDFEQIYMRVPKKEIARGKIRLLNKSGNPVWFEKTQISILAEDGSRMWIIGLRDIDDTVAGALCEKEYRVISLIYGNKDMILIEKGASKIYGLKLERRKKYNYSSLMELIAKANIREEEQEEFIQNMSMTNLKQMLQLQGMYEFVTYTLKLDGTYAAIRFKVRYYDEKRDIILCTQELVERWAESDDLTGILNEQGFYRTVSKYINKKDDMCEYSLIYFDVKGFKAWNEMLGYNTANQLLIRVADRLKSSSMKPIAVGRITADNFVCLVDRNKIDHEEISRLCYSREEIDAYQINLRMHCGIYHITDKHQSIRTMCDRAKLAETYITNEYAIPYAEFSNKMDDAYLKELSVLNSLERALRRDEFKVFYQPVFDTQTRKVVSAEALVRWIMPGNKMVSPGVFIPALEERGHIAQLDYFVESSTQAFLEQRDRENKWYVPVSMNLSRMDFINEKFVQAFKENVDKTTLDHKYLRFEVTESAYVDVGDQGSELISELRRKGSKILIDDFGTGYSSLKNLLNIEFDILKIDMVFIRNIGIVHTAEEIIRSVIKACHKVGVKVVAEGVETEEQYVFLRDVQCDYIQGFYFSKPLPKEEFAQLLDQNQ